MLDKLFTRKIDLQLIPSSNKEELSIYIFQKCSFCKKNSKLSVKQAFFNKKICDNFCSFCLRNDFHIKNKDIFILSFKEIIAYLHLKKVFHLSDFVESHINSGLINPIFIYDEETMLWFLDFSKVKDESMLEEIFKTIVSILISFNLSINIPTLRQADFFMKFKFSIERFYKNRSRPNKKVLTPSIKDCGVVDANYSQKYFEKLIKNS